MALDDPEHATVTQALAERYGQAAPPRIAWNDTIARLLAHRSARSGLR